MPRRSLLLLASLCLLTSPALARPQDTVDYRQAFAALESKQYQTAANLAARGPDVVLNKALRGVLMAQPGNNYSFSELSQFITEHPDWPGLNGIRMIAEQKIPSQATYEQVINWFNAYPPLTSVGFYRFIDALDATGQAQKAATLIRARWVEKDLSADEQEAFRTRFAAILNAADHRARLDRLLWDNNITGARAMYPLVDSGYRAVAEARLALANQLSNAPTLVAAVPTSLQKDQGLLFERLRWKRKNNEDDGAVAILGSLPEQLTHAEQWWDERAVIIRRLIERRDYAQAYRLAASHGMDSGLDFTQAEFLAGWLALRFLNRADEAHRHFETLLEGAKTPVSRSRGAYWLGRSLEALGRKNEAEQAYETAAALSMTFYGQLALTRLYAQPTLSAPHEPPIPTQIRSQFFARDSVLATEHLYRIGQTDRARSFFKAITDAADQRFEFALLMELAYRLQRPDWAIMAAKAANQKNMIVAAGAFPILSMKMPTPPDPAFTHALIRQESLFRSDAGSPVGAKGLMQLMPGTAKGVAKKLGITYHESRLTDPAYNVQLGTAFAQEQLDKFNGSYILALAAYNAGPARVRQWLGQFGDPRGSRIDPIDWIEMMPIYETRNYVQRIMENFQIYRARLNGGQAPMTLLQDLKR